MYWGIPAITTSQPHLSPVAFQTAFSQNMYDMVRACAITYYMQPLDLPSSSLEIVHTTGRVLWDRH